MPKAQGTSGPLPLRWLYDSFVTRIYPPIQLNGSQTKKGEH